ncbi:MAG TPA: hypothetical protein VK530_09850 [Candidatus Acidoferrum sp.]|nr:hypothetical protein [Candidatus Acidoferrum sp.]
MWQRLEAARPSGEQLTARFALPDVTERLLAAIDSESKRHLLVPLAADEQPLEDSQSRGLGVVTREMLIAGRPTALYLDVICQDAAGHGAFDLIANDDFPRLTPVQFNGGVPGGVQYVEYEINLSGFERLRVARSASEAT